MSGEARILSLGAARRTREQRGESGASALPENRSLGRHTSLKNALNQLPLAWLQLMARQGGIRQAGLRAAWVSAIAERWTHLPLLRRVLKRLSMSARTRLVTVQRQGSWMLASHYGELFPDDLPFEESDWQTHLPESPLGRLRYSGFVFLGRARVSGEETGILVIPKELREPLAVLAWDELSRDSETEVEFLRHKKKRRREEERRRESPRPSLLSHESAHDRAYRFVNQGVAALTAEKVVHAQQWFEAAIDTCSTLAAPWLFLGEIALKQEKLSRARQMILKGWKRSIADVPMHVDGPRYESEISAVLRAYYLMAQLNVAEGRVDRAATELERLLQLDWQDRLEARHWLPEVLLASEAFATAEARFQDALSATLPRPWYGIGLAQACQGRLDDAVLHWRRAILLNEYVPPLLHGQPVRQSDVSIGDPASGAVQWAESYVRSMQDLFDGQPEAKSLLLRLWRCGPVAWERRQMTDLRRKWHAEKNSDLRVAWHRKVQQALDPKNLQVGAALSAPSAWTDVIWIAG